jgi:uncharacterized protein
MTPLEKYTPGQKVNLVILRETDLGYVAEINGEDEGLLYHNETFEHLEPDQEISGYIQKVRPNGAIDLQLQAFGHHSAEEVGARIMEELKYAGGFLAVDAKTPAEKIYELFGVSKKKYKMALGGLYKKRLIKITEKGIELTGAED